MTKESPVARRRVLLGSLAGAAVVAVLAVAALNQGETPEQAAATAAETAAPGTTASANPRASANVTDPPPATPTGSTPANATSPADPTPATPAGSPTPTSSVKVWEGPPPPPVDANLSKGSAQAPVTIVEFGDFKCPNCRRFAQRIEPELKSRYLDTGIVRMFWRDYPIRGRDSVRAAVAARAASRQGRFWEFHDALYAGEQPRLTDANLRSVAARIGLDLGRFDADRRDESVRQVVDGDLEFALELGLSGTPAFLINGELLFGAQPLAAFEKAIEKARRAG
ncbi:thioredoxin domain-containing protein [Nonomuraea sp. NEAU-A123]|uniref:DsbA family protein n=1 Tax=Nonomuraea sp. NEAU-A123 TaxID=2839649 RepID=UPI001BE4BF17|nr:thioredoxin domain-containing protein [Nonomuraea sp. NEAU-A123]MBT2230053.1 thioredoxin domain-containing protein [Nonomuraea sp. NEAU-A123]MBT2230677.1 thioredoxin domain-containing protein [Nonomuraea sp. NEAU-A123]